MIDWSGAAAHPAKTATKGCKLVSLACHGRKRHTDEMGRAMKAMGLQPLHSGNSVEFVGEDFFSDVKERQLHESPHSPQIQGCLQ